MVPVIADGVVVPEMARKLLGWLLGGVRAISAYVGEPSEATCILDSCVSRLPASVSACALVSTNWAFTCDSSVVNSSTAALSSTLSSFRSSIAANTAASVSLAVGSLPLPAPFFLPIVEPDIDRVRFARGAPGASVSISVVGSMSISLFSSCALALPNSAAFGVLVRARPDRRVGDALFASDSITTDSLSTSFENAQ
ncbi:hypothetical protein PSPO01_16222 [Paraphaeosphaeria sporulosa]